MKILYLSNVGIPAEYNFPLGDFLCDSVFHGLRTMEGVEVVDYPKIQPMYNNASDEVMNRTYGGFTLYKTLEDVPVDREDIDAKIKNHYFDLIIYGQATRCLNKLEIVKQYYKDNEIIFLDGEDEQDVERKNLYPVIRHNAQILKTLTPSKIFKRELNKEITPDYLPISFSIPKEKFYKGPVQKIQTLARESTTKPGGHRFNNEEEYCKEYQNSYFATTNKKAGWDCLRHYEIIANQCIPYFRDIYDIPSDIMTNYPVHLVKEGMLLINKDPIDSDTYQECLRKIMSYVLAHCTTESAAKYITGERTWQT